MEQFSLHHYDKFDAFNEQWLKNITCKQTLNIHLLGVDELPCVPTVYKLSNHRLLWSQNVALYFVVLHYFLVWKDQGLFYNTKTSILGTEKQLSYYILETVPTLLIFSSSRSSPKSVGFRTCFSTIRSLSWISICRGGPYRHSLNWDGSIMPTSKQDQDIFLN